MRDLLVTVVVLGSVPLIFFSPDVGVLVWTWLAFMNPHRISWGFARELPFGEIVAIATFVGIVVSGRWRRPPLSAVTVLLTIFILWTVFTSLLALNQKGAWAELERFLKIQVMVFVTMMLVLTREKLRALIWVVVGSIGIFGVVGGLFTLRTGGEHRVWGPDDTFIGGNNEIALALAMTIPFMRYLQLTTSRRWVSYGLLAMMVLSVVAILGTHSRGGLLGLLAMLSLLVWKSRYRVSLALVFFVTVPISISLMPQKWFDRMDSIRNYREDESAIERLNSWQFAWNLALDRPVIGAGFNCFTHELFARYAPEPTDVHDSHSIYFEVLAEHGFVGLLLFLCLAVSVWLSCASLTRKARDHVHLSELEHLGRMSQVSFVAYGVSGAFLGLAYFDLVYTLIAIVVIAKVLLAATPSDDAEVDLSVASSSRFQAPFRTRKLGLR